jgi:cell division septation protein DedD
MENFDERGQHKIKEKNVYLLHLDAPRIIIIISVFIGIMVVSFLIGMNIDKKRDISEELFSKKDPLIDLEMGDKSRERNLFDNSIPETPLENGIALNTPDNASGKDNRVIIPKGNDNSKQGSITKDSSDTTDLLTNENIKEIIPPVKEVNKITQKHTVKSTDTKGNREKEQRKRAERKKRVIEVSSDKKRDSLNSNRKHYSIQVASYDRRSNAESEIHNLKGMHYDAYIDKKSIRGKKYYRVRIGPILSKKKAIRMLNEVQEINRYEDSYLIRE